MSSFTHQYRSWHVQCWLSMMDPNFSSLCNHMVAKMIWRDAWTLGFPLDRAKADLGYSSLSRYTDLHQARLDRGKKLATRETCLHWQHLILCGQSCPHVVRLTALIIIYCGFDRAQNPRRKNYQPTGFSDPQFCSFQIPIGDTDCWFKTCAMKNERLIIISNAGDDE